jgi:ABC-2 type transport system ATP-binding protein
VGSAIKITDLTVTYPRGLFRKPGRGVQELTITVERGELFGFLGPNGAGKSTTIKVLNSLLPATAGSVAILDSPIHDRRTRARVGYMPENPYFYEYLTALETLQFYGALFHMNRADARSRGAELLGKVGLRNVDDVRVGEYSKGMRQRLGFAQSLINDPEVLILDEPLSGLDPIGRSELMDFMRELNAKGKTVFVSSHILPDIEHTCSRVGLITEGRLIEAGPMEEILNVAQHSIAITVRSETDPSETLGAELEVTRNATGYYVITTADQAEADRVVALCSSRGMTIVSVMPVRLSLEEFFVQRIKAREDA